MKALQLLFAIAALTVFTTQAIADWKNDYPSLVFGIVTGENAKDARLRWEPMQAYLAEQLGVPIKLRQASDYAGIIEAHAVSKVDIVWYSGASYATAYWNR